MAEIFFKENYMMKFLNGKRTGVIDTHLLIMEIGETMDDDR
ncbi:MAG: hypothetical protein ACLSFA_13715 [Roseburia inulinivorans]